MQEYFTKTDLKTTKGWTESLIKTFLPTPDKEYQNPRSKKAGNIKLYLVAKVESIEAEADFVFAKGKADNRKSSGKKSAETRRTKLLLEISLYEPNIKIIGKSYLYEKSEEHYYDRMTFSNNDRKWRDFGRDPNFKNRIAVNYLRHELSDYEHKLSEIAKKTGVDDAYEIIRKKIDDAIFEAYPYLK